MKCPVCNSDFENLTGLKLHVQRIHLTNFCPICGKRVRFLLTHLNKTNDTKHKQLWAVLAKSRSYVSQNGKEMIKLLRDGL